MRVTPQLRGEVASQSARIAALERYTLIADGAPGATIGDAIGTVAARLAAWETRIDTHYLPRVAFESALGELDGRVSATLRALQETMTPREAFAMLHAAHTANAESLSALSGSVATKVDRSELLRLQAVAADLEGWAAWKRAASDDLRNLARGGEEQRGALESTVASLSRLSAVLQATGEAVQGKADR